MCILFSCLSIHTTGAAAVSYTHLIQGGGKINHIPIRTAAEAVVTPIQLHAWGFIVMERATSHPVPTYMDSIMLRSLSCCDGLLHSFKYIQIYPSLKIRKAPDILLSLIHI